MDLVIVAYPGSVGQGTGRPLPVARPGPPPGWRGFPGRRCGRSDPASSHRAWLRQGPRTRLDLALGLRRKSVDHLDTQDLHDLLPLGFGLIGLENVFAPQAVTSLDEAEDAQRVDVVAQRDCMGFYEGLGGLDVVPGRFDGEEVGKKQLAAVVIDGRDQGPLLLGIGRPQMEGSIMPAWRRTGWTRAPMEVVRTSRSWTFLLGLGR
jgi:hypothetical protein